MSKDSTLSIHTRSVVFSEEQGRGFPEGTDPLRLGQESLASTISQSLHRRPRSSGQQPDERLPNLIGDATSKDDEDWQDIQNSMNAMRVDTGDFATIGKVSHRDGEMPFQGPDISEGLQSFGNPNSVSRPDSYVTDLSASSHGISTVATDRSSAGNPNGEDVVRMLRSTLKEFIQDKKLDLESSLPFPGHYHEGFTAQKDLSRCRNETLMVAGEDHERRLTPKTLRIVLLKTFANVLATTLKVDIHILKCLKDNLSEAQTGECETWIQICRCTLNRIYRIKDEQRSGKKEGLKCKSDCGKHGEITPKKRSMPDCAREMKKEFEEFRGELVEWLNSPFRDGSNSIADDLPGSERVSLLDLFEQDSEQRDV